MSKRVRSENKWFLDSKILKVIAASYPHLIEEAKNNITPVMTDLDYIQDIYHFVILTHKPHEDFQHKLFFIATVLKMFNPEALVIDCKLHHGLRRAIADSLGYSGQSTSYYISQSRAYMKIKSFKAAVGQITESYLNQNLVS